MLYRLIFLGALFSTITACSWLGLPNPFVTHNNDYLKTQSIPPLYIPPGLTSDKFENHYPIPNRVYPPGAANISLAPPDLR